METVLAVRAAPTPEDFKDDPFMTKFGKGLMARARVTKKDDGSWVLVLQPKDLFLKILMNKSEMKESEEVEQKEEVFLNILMKKGDEEEMKGSSKSEEKEEVFLKLLMDKSEEEELKKKKGEEVVIDASGDVEAKQQPEARALLITPPVQAAESVAGYLEAGMAAVVAKPEIVIK
jgi:hypothetical protein